MRQVSRDFKKRMHESRIKNAKKDSNWKRKQEESSNGMVDLLQEKNASIID